MASGVSSSEPCTCGHVYDLHDQSGVLKACTLKACPCKAFGMPRMNDVELPEPPMTPEEEEQAPPFVQSCIRPGCLYDVETDCRYGCRASADELSREANEMEPPPPQPERRPPLAVAYSVQGHLYEVALPGDASVLAMNGALVIEHALGPVAGIVQVRPIVSEGGADGAE